MTIASEITKLNTNLTNSYTAVSGKGGTLPQAQNFDNLATAISSIPSGGGSKFGANVNTFLGDVDANGVLQTPTEQSDLVFTGVKDVASSALAYKFYNNKVKSVSFPNLTTIRGVLGCGYMFYNCTALTSVSFPNLTTISEFQGCNYMFYGCTALTSVSFPALTTISGSYGCSYMFYGCTALTSVSLPNLTTVSGSSACQYMFRNCTALTNVYFPALTASSFGSYKNQFQNMMSGTGSTVTHTLHFPSNMESTISGLTGYPLFGGTSGKVVLSFDLDLTE